MLTFLQTRFYVTLCYLILQKFFKNVLFQGNHGEDVKECYYYLYSDPEHKYTKALYKYPQSAFPYNELFKENCDRDRKQPEYELIDTGK